MEQTEAKEIYQMGVEALNDCDYRMAGAYFQNAVKMNCLLLFVQFRRTRLFDKRDLNWY